MRPCAVLLPLLLPACATVAGGRTQIVAITTDPPGAACVVDHAAPAVGGHLDEVPSTPGTVLVQPSAAPLRVTCAAPGIPPRQGAQAPGVNPYVWGNTVTGGPLGLAVDVSSGAYDRYPSQVHLDLRPRPAPPPPTAAPASPPISPPVAAVPPVPPK